MPGKLQGAGLFPRSLYLHDGELYQEYRSYCMRTGEYARGTADFYNALESAGFMRQKTKTGNFIRGLRIREDFED